MAADNSFDIVSKVDIQEVRNAIDQASKEVHNRFDLKNSHSEIRLEGDDAIQLASADEYKLKAVTEILAAEAGQARHLAQDPHLWQGRTSLRLQRPPEDHPPAGHRVGEGERNCPARQRLEEKGPGLDSG